METPTTKKGTIQEMKNQSDVFRGERGETWRDGIQFHAFILMNECIFQDL